MFKRTKMRRTLSNRGVTLVELMIVVAIIGILALLSSIAYKRYINSANVTRMKTVATEVWGKQKLHGNKGYYFNPGGDYASQTSKYQNGLEFTLNQVASDMSINTMGWDAGGACPLCAAEGVTVDTTEAGFIVVIKQDLNPDDVPQTTVLMTHDNSNQILRNEGS